MRCRETSRIKAVVTSDQRVGGSSPSERATSLLEINVVITGFLLSVAPVTRTSSRSLFAYVQIPLEK